jgi:hypothetical protein
MKIMQHNNNNNNNNNNMLHSFISWTLAVASYEKKKGSNKFLFLFIVRRDGGHSIWSRWSKLWNAMVRIVYNCSWGSIPANLRHEMASPQRCIWKNFTPSRMGYPKLYFTWKQCSYSEGVPKHKTYYTHLQTTERDYQAKLYTLNILKLVYVCKAHYVVYCCRCLYSRRWWCQMCLP